MRSKLFWDLRSVKWQLHTEFRENLSGRKDGTDKLSRNVGKTLSFYDYAKYIKTRRAHLYRVGNHGR